MPLANAQDFEPAIDDIQDQLPDWWAAQNPASQMYLMLLAVAGTIDLVSELWEQPYLDQVITTASQYGLVHNFAFAWGVQNEQLPTVPSQLVAYLQARAAEDGSLLSMINTLTTLVDTPQNTTGGNVLTFSGDAFDEQVNELAPAAWWKLADAAGSDTAEDTSGGGHPGTVTGGVMFGEPGPPTSGAAAASFDGSSGYIQTEFVPAAGAVTVLAWFQTASTSVDQFIYDFRGASSGGILDIVSGRVRFSLYNTAGALFSATSPSPSNDGKWHLAVGTFDGTSILTCYVDGQQVATAALTGTPSVGGSFSLIGAPEQETIDFFDGALAEVAVLPLALTAEQVAGLWNSDGPLQFPPDGSGLVTYEFGPPDGPTTSVGLIFPPDGSGLIFPAYPSSLPSDNVIVQDGTTPVGAGPGLIFASNQFVQVIPDYETSVMTVKVQNWLAFDRGAFARAVARFQSADWYPTVIQEVTTFD